MRVVTNESYLKISSFSLEGALSSTELPVSNARWSPAGVGSSGHMDITCSRESLSL